LKPPAQAWLRAALTPLSWLYGTWMTRRNAHYDRPAAVAHVSVPVISIGNLSVGGTGKTPMVRWIAETMLGRGVRPAIVSRGYGGSAGTGPVVVSRGDAVECAARVAGDEPWMLANAVAGAIVVVGSNRTAGARKAVELGARLVLLDDGFQHRALGRDLDVVLLDRTRPFDLDRVLPSGSLREPASSLARADWIIITRSASPRGAERLHDAIRASNPSARILHADHSAAGFIDAAGVAVPQPSRAVAFCAIGNPQRFRTDLERLGVSIAAFHAFLDHRSIDASMLGKLQRQAKKESATLVTTEKDLARIGLEDASRVGLLVLTIRTVVPQGEQLIEAIEQIASGRPS
jgi:tetraacyldisaccharide 4'-kinase